MAIIGAHSLVYTSEPEAVRAIFRDVFGWKHVDAGDGWLIFALPPGEVGVHPAAPGEASTALTLMCDSIGSTLDDLRGVDGIEILNEPAERGFGIVSILGLPGGVQLQLYEPHHPLAIEQ